ncbi:8404_t:CDS:2 [Paraglomus occultum]|uniref:8404_t:CDS:1 n=1 Tax=Paraglomus occultum TaxID=144539 RepID=A0A9N9GTV8_9GLOM|nr:8404_t:CDS:2 [Paraglomus occultum]
MPCRRSFHNSLSGVTRTYLVACHSRLIAEPQNWCQGTSDLLGCLMFWWDREPKTDRRRARDWDQERSRKQVHINQPIVATVHGDGNITNIGDGNGGTIVSSKRDKEEEDERNQTKRVRFHEEKPPLKKKSKSGKKVGI